MSQTANAFDRLKELERFGELCYQNMDDAVTLSAATGYYADAKDAFRDAAALALELGDDQTAERLTARLEHIKAVFRSQYA